MEQLKHMEETLMGCVQAQLSHLETVDTEELGQAIDMIKDLEQARYYCSVVKAMEEATGEETRGKRKYYKEPDDYYYPWPEREKEIEIRDYREGKSPKTRRMYMESKQLHKDKTEKVRELEKYMQELSEDIVEMIEGASAEERQMLEKKMTSLTNKIAQLNLNA